MKTQIIVAGHGGQGVLELANYISYYSLLGGKHVAYTPSYGPESRGGKVKCYVVASEEEIDSPIVERPDFLIVMNAPSMDFVKMLRNGGSLLMNSSLISAGPDRTDVLVAKVPATELALGLGTANEAVEDTRIVANSVMFGAFLALTEVVPEIPRVEEVFEHFLSGRKAAMIPLNVRAVEAGQRYSETKQRQRYFGPADAPTALASP
jgi:2-oxoglutarate ferredoxin oxidoreductase subunit gamma